ncbi:HTH-type transcriptional regulator DmlR [Sinobacterium norvegicum]|uniref:HTH-type transcriptional regulator DmlR n=1 Tax=Sinobacterium norvegicum TaxID=1641715 RepID=A0ABN8EJC4_9GAMM|nr:LysR family transcriptional regulator [Sinobacterium norvegicum]CAH0992462.1 HTH-type transcriptional regulator DmlR [Sinobacterium norvegicum]
MTQIEQYLIFGQAAQAGSFSRAAEQLGVSNSHVSKHIAKLEQSLGYKLFNRSPRLQLTDSGASLLPEVTAMMAAYQSLTETAPTLKGEASGLVRLSLPPLLARKAILPRLAPFLRQNPKLKVEINIQQSTLQAFSENTDLVVTLGSLPDSSLVCQRIGECETLLVATPAYLQQNGVPASPVDLRQHICLASQYPNFENATPWQLRKNKERHAIEVNSPVATNDIYAVKQLVLDNLGIGVMLKFFVEQELSNGHLVPVLDEYDFAMKPPIYIISHDRELMPKSVSLFKAFLIEAITDGLSMIAS